MNRDQFAAYYDLAVDRIVARLIDDGIDPPVARVAVQEAMIRATIRRRELGDEAAADAKAEPIARQLSRSWAPAHLDAFPDLLVGTGSPVALDFAQVERLARRRATRRTAFVAVAVACALALIAFPTVNTVVRRQPWRPPPPASTPGSSCPAPAAWRTALSPLGAAWDLSGVVGGPRGAAAWKRLDDDRYALFWLPDADPGRRQQIDTVPPSRTGLADPDGTPNLLVGDGDVAWTHDQDGGETAPPGGWPSANRVLKVWDGTSTQEVTSGRIHGVRLLANHTVQFLRTVSATSLTKTVSVERYDITAKQTTTLLTQTLSVQGGISAGATFYALRPEQITTQLFTYDGQQIGTVTEPGEFPHPLTDTARDAYLLGSGLHIVADGKDHVAWPGATASPTSPGKPLGASLSGDFLLYASADGFHIVDLSTQRQAIVPRYSQQHLWYATATLNGGVVTYAGLNAAAIGAAASGAPAPDPRAAVPDGGPRFSRLSDLPHITC